jgi:hypothetical protein
MGPCRPSLRRSILERLTAVAHAAEQACLLSPDDVLVRVIAHQHEVELGLLPLDPDLHPCEELRGFVAPEEWWAVGLVVRGRAHLLDEPDRQPEPIVSTFFIERGGAEVSLLRRGNRVDEGPGRAEGRLPDLCRSMVGRT